MLTNIIFLSLHFSSQLIFNNLLSTADMNKTHFFTSEPYSGHVHIYIEAEREVQCDMENARV